MLIVSDYWEQFAREASASKYLIFVLWYSPACPASEDNLKLIRNAPQHQFYCIIFIGYKLSFTIFLQHKFCKELDCQERRGSRKTRTEIKVYIFSIFRTLFAKIYPNLLKSNFPKLKPTEQKISDVDLVSWTKFQCCKLNFLTQVRSLTMLFTLKHKILDLLLKLKNANNGFQ